MAQLSLGWAVTAVGLVGMSAAHMVLPWMCLERCEDNATVIAGQMHQFATNTSVLNAAAFEDYNLGPNSTLIKNNLTQVARPLHQMGVETWAMISSFPYPPQFLSWMREVFANPQPFIDACLAAAASEKLTGFNVDWEPVTGDGAPIPTEQDAQDYAAFLTVYSNALHAAGVKTSVDVATWSLMWNLTAISASSVDYIMTMQTYGDNFTAWKVDFANAVAVIPAEKLVLGLMTYKGSNNATYSTAELKERFDIINAAGVDKVGLWRAGVPDNWWPFLDALGSGKQ